MAQSWTRHLYDFLRSQAGVLCALWLSPAIASAQSGSEPVTPDLLQGEDGPALCFEEARQCGYKLGLTAGSSFAPSGVGFRIGYEVGRWQPYLGWAFVSKSHRLGHPVSAGTKFALWSNIYMAVSASYFYGSGKRDVVFDDPEQGSQEKVNCAVWNDCTIGTIHDANVRWRLLYGHLGFGIVPWKRGNVRLAVEGGIARNLWSKITVSDEVEDEFGRPRLIAFRDTPRVTGVQAGAGPNDAGPYASIALEYTP